MFSHQGKAHKSTPPGLRPEPADQVVSMESGAPLEILRGKQRRRAFCCGNAPYLDLDGSYTRVNRLKIHSAVAHFTVYF